MEKDGVWENHLFVQVTAWYLGLDIQILTTSATEKSPFIFIYCNINKPEEPAPGPTILIGNYTNIHYQSLLPIMDESNRRKEKQPKCVIVTKTIIEKEKTLKRIFKQDDFIYTHNDEKIIVPNRENEEFLCHYCGKTFARLLSHITSKKCLIHTFNIDATQFKNQLNSFKKGFQLEMGRKRYQKHFEKKKDEKGIDIVKEEQNQRKLKSQAKLRKMKGTGAIKEDQNKRKMKSLAKVLVEKGPVKVREEQKSRTLKSLYKKLDKDPEAIRNENKHTKRLSRQKQRKEDSKKVKENQNKWQQKLRLVDTDKKKTFEILKKNYVQCNIHMHVLPEKPV